MDHNVLLGDVLHGLLFVIKFFFLLNRKSYSKHPQKSSVVKEGIHKNVTNVIRQ